MSAMQISASGPYMKLKPISPSQNLLIIPHLCISRPLEIRVPAGACQRVASNASSYKRCSPVCLFGGKGNSENNNENSPWKSLEKAMGGLRKDQSVQDILRKQMQEQSLNDDGGGAGSPPGAGGDGSGGSEDEGFAGILDELLQVILATIGFIFLYTYIITGEELTKLARDYIKYLFGGSKSVRLREAMHEWGKTYQELTRKEVEEEDWLERAIISTPTWWHSPRKLKLLRSRLERLIEKTEAR